MLIHSVSPPHLLIEQPQIPRPCYKQVNGAYLEGRDTPRGFQVSRIHSTDPAMYLDGSLKPGSYYRG